MPDDPILEQVANEEPATVRPPLTHPQGPDMAAKTPSYSFKDKDAYTIQKDFPNIGEGEAQAIVNAVAAGEDVSLENVEKVPGIGPARATAMKQAVAAKNTSEN